MHKCFQWAQLRCLPHTGRHKVEALSTSSSKRATTLMTSMWFAPRAWGHLDPPSPLQYRFSSWLLCTQCPQSFCPIQHSPLHARRVPDPRKLQLTQTRAIKGPIVTQVPRVPHTIRMLEVSFTNGETALLSNGSAQNLAALYSRTKSAPKD